jgi:hypothetical protein
VNPAACQAASSGAPWLIRERRLGRVVGALTLAGVAVTLAAVVISARAAHDPEVHGALRAFAAHQDEQLLAVGLRLAGLVLTLPFLALWHRVLRVRDASVSARVLAVGVTACVMIGVSTGLGWTALHDAAQHYRGADLDRQRQVIDANHVLDVVRWLDIGSRVLFAGWLAYSSLRASRVGLLTPFLGMWGLVAAVTGVVLPIGDALYIGWLASCALMLAGYWPGGLPPSWRTGKPEPWNQAPDSRSHVDDNVRSRTVITSLRKR